MDRGHQNVNKTPFTHKVSPMCPLIAGIDPGLHGAIVFLHAYLGTITKFVDMPLRETKSGKNELDPLAAAKVLSDLEIGLVVIEDVGPAPTMGMASAFNFGHDYGVLAGICTANGHAIHYSKPAVWKSVLKLGRDKSESRELASKLWPKHAEIFKRVKDDGRAEAALLAQFGRKILNQW